MLDNTPSTYSLQPSNGLPIPSWTGSVSDDNLNKLSKLLELLSNVDDVRKYIPKFVRRNAIMFQKAFSILECDGNEMTPKRVLKNSIENRSSNNQIKRKLFSGKPNSKVYRIDIRLKNNIKSNSSSKMGKQGMTPLRKVGENYSISLDPEMNINRGKYIRRNNTNNNNSRINNKRSILNGNNDSGYWERIKINDERKQVESKIKAKASREQIDINKNKYHLRKYRSGINPENNSSLNTPYQYKATKFGNEPFGNYLNSNDYINLYAKISTSNFGNSNLQFE